MAKQTPQKSTPGKLGWSGAFRDIVVHSISKGQFPLVLIPMLFLGTLILIPDFQRTTWLSDVGNSLKGGSVLGWVLLVIESVVWYLTAKGKRHATQTEFNRLNAEIERLRADIRKQNSNKTPQ
jgi:hypothetical protein